LFCCGSKHYLNGEKKTFKPELPLRSRYITTIKEKLYITHTEGIVRIQESKTDKHVSTFRYVHGMAEVDGDVLACCEAKGGVYRILSVGSKLRGPVMAVQQPRAMCFCPDSRRLFVSHSRSCGSKANRLTVGRV